jgi:hypothetical protein
MFPLGEENILVQDREDLIAVLRMRFGEVPPAVIDFIYAVYSPDTLQRLILVAANAPGWKDFLDELFASDESFRMVGESYHPLERSGVKSSGE